MNQQACSNIYQYSTLGVALTDTLKQLQEQGYGQYKEVERVILDCFDRCFDNALQSVNNQNSFIQRGIIGGRVVKYQQRGLKDETPYWKIWLKDVQIISDNYLLQQKVPMKIYVQQSKEVTLSHSHMRKARQLKKLQSKLSRK